MDDEECSNFVQAQLTSVNTPLIAAHGCPQPSITTVLSLTNVLSRRFASATYCNSPWNTPISQLFPLVYLCRPRSYEHFKYFLAHRPFDVLPTRNDAGSKELLNILDDAFQHVSPQNSSIFITVNSMRPSECQEKFHAARG